MGRQAAEAAASRLSSQPFFPAPIVPKARSPETCSGKTTVSVATNSEPLVTVVVAAFNEERHIERCLRQILDQRLLSGEIEVLVFDGRSTDRTRHIVDAIAASDPRVQVHDNPERFQVYAYNRAIKMARGQYMMFAVVHAEYADEYFAQAIKVANRMGAVNVSGVARAVGSGLLGGTIAWAMSSPFGVGDATFRYLESERYADSVFVGFLRREAIVDIGGFNENVPFDEDTDLNLRLRRAGYKLAISPKLQCRYHVRTSLQGLAHQMFRYGFWRRKSQLNFGTRIPLRVMAPPALVLSLALTPVLPPPMQTLVPFAYGLFLTVATARSVPRLGAHAVLVPLVLTLMHVSYGLGWLKGLAVHRKPSTAGNADAGLGRYTSV